MTGTETWRVDRTNLEQAAAWNGDEGDYWADHAERFESSTDRYDPHLFDAAGLTPSSRVIDVGCGTGGMTLAAARLAASGSVLGIDLSRRMIDVARRQAEQEGIDNVRFAAADAQVHAFEPGAADAVVSKTGAMFFGDPVAAFGNLARALRPGGRLVLLVWQGPGANEWFLDITTALAAGRDRPAPPPDAPGPFALADPERVREILTAGGFDDIALADVREPMGFGPDAASASDFVAGLLGWMLDGLDAGVRARALSDLRATMAAHEQKDGVWFGSAMWLVTAFPR